MAGTPSKKRNSRVTSKADKVVLPSQRKARRAHLLIIECDADHLAQENKDLGSKFGQFVRNLMPNKTVVVVLAKNEKDLAQDLAETFQKYGVFRSILIVGHSNEHGLKLTAEPLRSWTVVGRWLKIFEPDYLFLTACEAGKSGVVRSLFEEVLSLREIYGSPSLLDAYAHTPPIAAILLSLLKTGRLNANDSTAYRLAGLLLTGGQIFRWRRDELGPGEELSSRAWDLAAEAMRHIRQ